MKELLQFVLPLQCTNTIAQACPTNERSGGCDRGADLLCVREHVEIANSLNSDVGIYKNTSTQFACLKSMSSESRTKSKISFGTKRQ